MIINCIGIIKAAYIKVIREILKIPEVAKNKVRFKQTSIPVLNDANGQAFTHLHLYGEIRGIRNKCGVLALSNEQSF